MPRRERCPSERMNKQRKEKRGPRHNYLKRTITDTTTTTIFTVSVHGYYYTQFLIVTLVWVVVRPNTLWGVWPKPLVSCGSHQVNALHICAAEKHVTKPVLVRVCATAAEPRAAPHTDPPCLCALCGATSRSAHERSATLRDTAITAVCVDASPTILFDEFLRWMATHTWHGRRLVCPEFMDHSTGIARPRLLCVAIARAYSTPLARLEMRCPATTRRTSSACAKCIVRRNHLMPGRVSGFA